MAIEDPRTPNQRRRTTTVETTTTGPASGEYGRRATVQTTETAPVYDEYTIRPDVPATAAPDSDAYAPRARVDRTGPSNGEYARSVTVFVAGIVQALIILRIVLLLLDARAANGLVAAIMNVSGVFVAPFQGILHQNALSSAGSVFDMAAIVALIGWTLVEGLVIAGIGIFRREPA
jgi:hypothetical protein